MMKAPWIPTMLAAAITASAFPAHATPLVASALVDPGQASDAPIPIRLEIGVEGLGGYPDLDPNVYDVMIRTSLTEVLKARGYDVLDPKAAASGVDVLRVELAWRDFDASVYAITYSTTPEGRETQRMPEYLCEHCADDDLVGAVDGHLDEALASLVVVEEPPPDEQPPPDEPPPELPPDDTEPKPKKFPPLAGVGIGLAAVGLVGLGVGGYFVARGEEVEPAPSGAAENETTDFRPPGYGALAGGGVLLVTGVTLLIVGLRQNKKGSGTESADARVPAQRRLTFVPGVSRHGASLGLTGRF